METSSILSGSWSNAPPTATHGMRLMCRIPFAASPHGLGTLLTTIMRSPGTRCLVSGKAEMTRSTYATCPEEPAG